MMNMIEVSENNFEQAVAQADGPVLVDFYASWCGPCKMLGPVLDKLATEYAGRVKFAKVNVDDAPRLAGRFDITGVPTLILFQGSLVLETFVGVPSARSLKGSLDRVAPAALTANMPVPA
jgi:thioredoxin 1